MKCLLLLLLVVSFPTHSSFSDCLKGKLPFFQHFSQYRATGFTKIAALQTACHEIEWPGMADQAGILERGYFTALSFVGFGGLGQAAGAFSTLSSTPTGQRYMRELAKIRLIENPIERLRQTYDLAQRHSGHYDYETNGMDTWSSGYYVGAHRPENLLANHEAHGTVGVCREFAALLNWSLLQVSRHASSRHSALGPHDFSATFIGGTLPGPEGWSKKVGHAWVRVNLPVYVQGRLTDFTHLDLDTTWYPAFTPLFPRRSGLSKSMKARLLRECDAIISCVNR